SKSDQLPLALASLVRKSLRWTGVTPDMVIEVLRLTHSMTGQLAEEQIRKRLPNITALRRLEAAQIDAAFAEMTTLQVADRLAQISEKSMGQHGVTLDSVFGLGDVRGHLDRMLNDLQEWRLGQIPWQQVTRSAVFHGPPGTGKTLLAKAFAGSAGVPFISTSYADCQKAGHQGDMLAALANAFEQAAQAAPSVLFIDEIDSFSTRDSVHRNSSYMQGIVNGLLEQINHVAEVPGVILLSATNHLNVVDPAVIRSGRFDLKLHIGCPDRTGIEAILAARVGPNHLENVDLASISKRLIGETGAAVDALVRDALGRARADKIALQQRHLDQAANLLVPSVCASLDRRIAVHEVGHVLATMLLSLPNPTRVQLTGQGGRVERPPQLALTPNLAKAQLQVLLAGRAAEVLLFGVASSGSGVGPTSDLAQATELALDIELRWGLGTSGLIWRGVNCSTMHTLPPEITWRIEAHLCDAQAEVFDLLQANAGLLQDIADRLLEVRELDALELEEISRNLTRETIPRVESFPVHSRGALG
ncbi:MAG: AAA family ATPase, partial [Sulfitobacter sp.]|nr:AAA family ATPase [Sulfitobacter sp.]